MCLGLSFFFRRGLLGWNSLQAGIFSRPIDSESLIPGSILTLLYWLLILFALELLLILSVSIANCTSSKITLTVDVYVSIKPFQSFGSQFALAGLINYYFQLIIIDAVEHTSVDSFFREIPRHNQIFQS